MCFEHASSTEAPSDAYPGRSPLGRKGVEGSGKMPRVGQKFLILCLAGELLPENTMKCQGRCSLAA